MLASTPPRLEDPVVIHKVAVGQEKRFLIRSQTVTGFYTHWTAATVLCGGDDCRWCFSGLERSWQGYIAVVGPPNMPGLLPIAAQAFEEWQASLAGHTVHNRIITVFRPTRWSGIRPQAESAQEAPPWPPLDDDYVFDCVCRLLRMPRKRAFPDRDSWVAAVQKTAASASPVYQLRASVG